jgi:hypothetical protein
MNLDRGLSWFITFPILIFFEVPPLQDSVERGGSVKGEKRNS